MDGAKGTFAEALTYWIKNYPLDGNEKSFEIDK